jgi:tRNA(Leu) C34 or U34 (ribose-2'-O)-methylase TrmL
VHQGALIEAEPLEEPTLADLVERSAGRPLIVLDQVTDPHNVGAILRSGAAFGTGGLDHDPAHSPPLDGALAKSASGALEHVPVALIQNLARALAELKELDCIVIGLDDAAADRIEELAWPVRSALVLGAEGKGLRQLTQESCDRLVRIADRRRHRQPQRLQRRRRGAAPGRHAAPGFGAPERGLSSPVIPEADALAEAVRTLRQPLRFVARSRLARDARPG